MKPPATPTKSDRPENAADVFDVRSIPGRTKHAQIFQRWSDLTVGQHFVLLNDHDPIPLYYQFSAEYPDTFNWEYLERGPEEFRVKITKLRMVKVATPVMPPTVARTTAARSSGQRQEIDVRGLEPPEPLVRILKVLESLPAGIALHAHTDREPCHLFGEAGQRGFQNECREQPDGSWITVLTHVSRS